MVQGVHRLFWETDNPVQTVRWAAVMPSEHRLPYEAEEFLCVAFSAQMESQLLLHAFEEIFGNKVGYMRAFGAHDPCSKGTQGSVMTYWSPNHINISQWIVQHRLTPGVISEKDQVFYGSVWHKHHSSLRS